MKKGTVVWYDQNLRYGFIHYDGTDYFVHRSMIVDDVILKEGDSVEFRPRDTGKERTANQVRVVT